MKTFKCILTVLMVSILAFSCASAGGDAQSAEPRGVVFSWDFDDPAAGTAGWVIAEGEFWDYKGTAALSWDGTTFGDGKLRFDVDFTADSASDWSEPKIKYAFAEPLDMTGVRNFTFDIYYNPEFSSRGSFNSKVIVLSGTRSLSDASGSLINAKEDAGNGYLKATVTLRIGRVPSIDNMVFSIAGYLTDYKGPVFFDNMRWE